MTEGRKHIFSCAWGNTIPLGHRQVYRGLVPIDSDLTERGAGSAAGTNDVEPVVEAEKVIATGRIVVNANWHVYRVEPTAVRPSVWCIQKNGWRCVTARGEIAIERAVVVAAVITPNVVIEAID